MNTPEHGGHSPDADLDFPAVLAGAKAGDEQAFECLVALISDRLSGYLRAQGIAEPEEVKNDVLLRIFTKLDTFNGDERRFRSWVFTIAHNLVVDKRRKRGRAPVLLFRRDRDPEPPGGDVEVEALAELFRTEVARLLDLLPRGQRDVLLLRVVSDLTIEQIAEVLGKRPGAVKALQRRALDRLRRNIRESPVPP